MRYLLTNRAWHTQTYSESPGVPWNTIPARQTCSMQLPLTHYRKQQAHGWISVNKLWYPLVFVCFACDCPKMSCIIQIWSLGCIYSAISIFYQLRCDKLLFIDPFKNVIYLAIYLCVCVCMCVGGCGLDGDVYEEGLSSSPKGTWLLSLSFIPTGSSPCKAKLKPCIRWSAGVVS